MGLTELSQTHRAERRMETDLIGFAKTRFGDDKGQKGFPSRVSVESKLGHLYERSRAYCVNLYRLSPTDWLKLRKKRHAFPSKSPRCRLVRRIFCPCLHSIGVMMAIINLHCAQSIGETEHWPLSLTRRHRRTPTINLIQ